MSSYKNYMDRIKLDDEQHEKLLEAVRAAEEKQASVEAETPQPAKVRRFPVKRLALIASAAAVIILAVGVIPGIGAKRASAPETYAGINEAYDTMNRPQTTAKTAAPGAAVTASEHFASLTEEAALTPAEPSAEMPDTEKEAPVTQASEHHTDPDTEVYHFSVRKSADAAKIPESYVYQASVNTANPTAAQQRSTEAPQENVEDGEKTASENAALKLFSYVLGLKKQMDLNAAAPDAGITPGTADYSFMLEDTEYNYDSEEGIFWTGEREYLLNESEQDELNDLLNEYFRPD